MLPIRPIPSSSTPRPAGLPDFPGVVRHALEGEALHRGLDRAGLRAAREAGTLRAFFEDRPPLALVQFDTPGLQEYVFRVSRPIDVRGGSSLVRNFTDRQNRDPEQPSIYRSLQQSQDLTSDNFIYAGGGNGLLVVPAYKADDVCHAIEQALSDITKGELRSVAVALPVWPEDLDHAASASPPSGLAAALGRPEPLGRYALARGVLQVRLARRRSEKTWLRASLVSPEDHARRCDACEVNVCRPRERPTADEAHICEACDTRRKLAGRERRHAQEARTFEDVVGVDARGNRAMAVLYADGANFGRLFREAVNPAHHHARSAVVDRAFEAARKRVETLVRDLAGAAVNEELRVQTAVAGGDDLVLVIPGRFALNAAQALLATLETSFDSELAALGIPSGQQPGVGLGVVVADCHFPLPLLLRYAKELMGLAKKKRLRGPSAARSAVDFMVLSSGSPLGGAIEESREHHPTRRPYARQEFDAFLGYVRALAEVADEAGAQIQAIRQEVLRGVEASRSLWRYQHARSDDERGWGRFRATLGCRLAEVDRLLWEPAADGSLTTRYLDAVEALACLDARGRR